MLHRFKRCGLRRVENNYFLEKKMKTGLTLLALLLPPIVAITTPAGAAVYCQWIGVPKGCVAKPGVVLRPAPGVGAPGVGVAPGVGAPGVEIGRASCRERVRRGVGAVSWRLK